MKTIGAFEAKTHLSSLLDRAEKGEEIVITRRGQPVAVLSPTRKQVSKAAMRLVINDIRRLRVGLRLAGVSIKNLAHEGHKY